MKFGILLLVLGMYALIGFSYFPSRTEKSESSENSIHVAKALAQGEVTSTQTKRSTIKQPASAYTIPHGTFVSQTFNNCGPASLSMLFSMYGKNITQEELASKMRPFNNPAGGVDDKSVFPEEFVVHAEEYGFSGMHRPNGNIEMMKKFVANDILVIVRTWLALDDDIGHYRIIKGYDDTRQLFIQDDSYQGANFEYSYDDFMTMWKPFNFEYVVIYPKDKQDVVEEILGKEMNEKLAWEHALGKAEADLASNAEDIQARFNVVTASYHVGNSKRTIEEFEKIQYSLAAKTLWYQLEPMQAYLDNKEYEKLFTLTNSILTSGNSAYSELYELRGQAYEAQENTQAAEAEFAKAYEYNKNFTITKKALKLN